jgi:hypothetical protein
MKTRICIDTASHANCAQCAACVLHNSNKIQHNNNEAAVHLLFGDEFDDSIEAQAGNNSTATIKGMLIYDEQDELIAIGIRDSGTGMDVAKLKAALIPHLSLSERASTSAAAADASSNSDKAVFKTHATGRVAHFGIGGNTTANSYGKNLLRHNFTRRLDNFSCASHALTTAKLFRYAPTTANSYGNVLPSLLQYVSCALSHTHTHYCYTTLQLMLLCYTHSLLLRATSLNATML